MISPMVLQVGLLEFPLSARSASYAASIDTSQLSATFCPSHNSYCLLPEFFISTLLLPATLLDVVALSSDFSSLFCPQYTYFFNQLPFSH